MVSQVREYFANNPELFFLVLVLDIVVLYLIYRGVKFLVRLGVTYFNKFRQQSH